MNKALETWDENRADATDVLVAQIRALIPQGAVKTAATDAIYAHVRQMQSNARQDERESCAQECDMWAAANIDTFREQALAAECVARRIRERGNK